MYWEFLPNPACHPKPRPKAPNSRIVMSEESATRIYLVQCRLFVKNELSLTCHPATTSAACSSISLQDILNPPLPDRNRRKR